MLARSGIKRKIKELILAKENESNSLLSRQEITKVSKIPRYEPGEISTRRGNIKFVDSCTLIEGVREIFLDKVYEFQPSSDEPFIVDCGANIGIASLYFKMTWAHSKVLAFEPDPDIFNCLEANLKNLGISDGVTAQQAAVWVHSDGVSFDIEGGFSGQITSHGHPAVKRTISVPSVRLKDIIRDSPTIDLLKIDIEGAEFEVLTDIDDVLKNVNNIFIEYHSHTKEPQKLDRILSILSNNSFRYHITDAYTVSSPFINRESMLGMDLQLNVFGYRIQEHH